LGLKGPIHAFGMLLEHLLWISIGDMAGSVIRDVREIPMEGVCPDD